MLQIFRCGYNFNCHSVKLSSGMKIGCHLVIINGGVRAKQKIDDNSTSIGSITGENNSHHGICGTYFTDLNIINMFATCVYT